MSAVRLIIPAALLLLVACTSSTTVSNSSFNEPVAMAAADTSVGPVVFVANATGDDLRALDVDRQIFVRGPNAISPLSIDVGFRPTRLASGIVKDSSGTQHAFIAAAGAAPRLALVSAATQDVVPPPSAPCGATITATCLPAPAVDIAIAGGELFADLGPSTAGGAPSLLVFTIGYQSAPTLSFDTAITLPANSDPAGIAALSDGSQVFVADRANARVMQVDVASGTQTDIAAPGPVARVALSPAYTAADHSTHVEGELALAVLNDGSLEPLDVTSRAPVPDPYDASKASIPLSFGSPVHDVAFAPCLNSGCTTKLSLTSSDTEAESALAFAALGDGTAVALEPDPGQPKLIVPVNPRASGQTSLITQPTATDATFTDNLNPQSSGNVSLPAKSITTSMGYTKTETWAVTDRGRLPGFVSRPGTLSAGGATLTDDAAAPFAPAADVRAGDGVDLLPLGSTCAAIRQGVQARVTAVAANTLTLGGLSRDLSACPQARVLYDVRVPSHFWTVIGSASGYVGRAQTGQPFVFAGERFFYPPASVTTKATATISVGFTIPASAPDDTDSTLAFSTSSGFAPFVVGSAGLSLNQGGLANSVTVVDDQKNNRELLYLTQVGSNGLVQVDLANVQQATGTVVFH